MIILIKHINKIITIPILIILIFLLSHSTEKLAVRTTLFTSGHPIKAFTSEIEKSDIYDEKSGRQYEVLANINDPGTGNYLTSLKVKRYFFLYFANFGAA